MGQAARWEKVAREWNGRYYPPKGLWQEQKVLAARDGYLAVIGTTRGAGTRMGYGAIRSPRGGTWRSLARAIPEDPAVLKALGKKVFPHRLRKRLRVAEGLLWFDQPYFFRPDPERLAALANAFIALLPAHVGRFDGRCEACGTVPVAEPVLLDRAPLTNDQFLWLADVNAAEPVLVNTPGYVCPGCLEKDQQEDARAERASAAQPAHPVRALLAGAAVALVGALVSLVLDVARDGIYGSRGDSHAAIRVGGLMTFVIAYAVRRGMGKPNILTKVLTPLLTLAGIFAGAVFYHAHLIRTRAGRYTLSAALQALLPDAQAEPVSAIAGVVGIVSLMILMIIISHVAGMLADAILEDRSSRMG